jgi:drug/metabolite transporter (DMT)-like permease
MMRAPMPNPALETGAPPPAKNAELSSSAAAALFATVVLAWGTSWPVMKLIVQHIPPLTMAAIRTWIAAVTVLPILLLQRSFVAPKWGDMPVVLSIALLHMVGFAVLVAAGLQYVPAGKAIVLGYTTPIWVAIGARAFLGEAITRWRALGIVLGLGGLGVIFNPQVFDWSDTHTLLGCGFVLVGAACWAVSIVYVRSHRWLASPFQLLFWQVLIAAVILTGLGLAVEGIPRPEWTPRLLLLLLYAGVVGHALAYWAMSMVNRSLPAITTSLGVLATPLVGLASAALILGEPIEPSLMVAALLIVGGIALGSSTRTQVRRKIQYPQSVEREP